MKLHEKIAHLRKENSWSQEALAEKMNVTRQAVSKWESGASNPELENILAMCRLFGVSADALLRDDVAIDGQLILPDSPKHPWLSMDDSYAYIADQQINVRRIALGVMLCVLSPGLGAALSSSGLLGEALGPSALLLMVAWAVYLFITTNAASEKYRHIKRGRFTPVPGVVEWASASLEHLRPRFIRDVAAGVMLCIISPALPMMIESFFPGNGPAEGLSMTLFFAFVAVACYLFVRSSCLRGCYQRLLRRKR